MIKKIVKRDGRKVKFDISKIENAITQAFLACDHNDTEKSLDLAIKVLESLEEDKITTPTVEDIQDRVEKVLIEEDYADVAKKYILYRAERTSIRESNTRLMKTYRGITFQDSKENDVKRENANIDGDTAMGTMLKYGSEGAKEFYVNYVLNKEHSKAHQNGDIHIHDLDFLTLTMTCCQIDILELFKGGFSTGHGFLREPNDIRSYASLACIAIQANQNDQHGGQSIPNFDYGLAPGVKKTYRKTYFAHLGRALYMLTGVECDEYANELKNKYIKELNLYPVIDDNNGFSQSLTKELSEKFDSEIVNRAMSFAKKEAYKETKAATYQAMESLVHNLNTMHSRAGAQVPFSSVNYGTDTSVEGRMVIEAILLATEAGLGNGETAIFPIQIFKVKEGINYNPKDPNYDLFKLACRVSAKRLFPNFSFIDAPFNIPYYKPGDYNTEIAYMGCRTRVIGNVYDKTREIVTGRGNLSFTSINLPRLGLLAKGNIEKFFSLVDERMNLVKEQLLERLAIQSKKKVYNFPFLMGQGVWIDSKKLANDDTVEEVIKHGSLSIGFIGLAECLKALIGKHHGESKEALDLGNEIVKHMREKADEFAKETNLNFTLLATPAEGLSGRFINIDKQKFGIIPGITDKEYYTNSFHVPVYHKISAYDKIKIEARFHAYTNAGHITYVELDGNPYNNLEAFESVVRCMKESGIGYGSINFPLDRDPVCGYSGLINDICPKCGRTEVDVPFDRIRRITGYLVGTLDRFNNAKRAEVRDRVKHNLSNEN